MPFTIAAYANGDQTVASSRLRSFYLLRDCANNGFAVKRDCGVAEALQANLIHIQKCLRNPKLYLIVVLARILGVRVVFDFDDQPHSIPVGILYYWFFLWSTSVTVDTEIKRIHWQSRLPWTQVWLIPDVVDICPEFEEITKISKTFDPEWRKNLFWIGYSGNLASIDTLLHSLKGRKDKLMTVIIEPAAVQKVKVLYPWISIVCWEVGILEKWDKERGFLMLNHAHTENAYFKSENKMVLALATGFIPIVSRTDAYERLALRLETDYLLYTSINSALDRVDEMSSAQIEHVTNTCAELVRHTFSSSEVFKKFSQALDITDG